MNNCTQCGSNNIQSHTSYDGGYFDTCMDCGWEEHVPGASRSHFDGFTLWLCVMLIIFIAGMFVFDVDTH